MSCETISTMWPSYSSASGPPPAAGSNSANDLAHMPFSPTEEKSLSSGEVLEFECVSANVIKARPGKKGCLPGGVHHRGIAAEENPPTGEIRIVCEGCLLRAACAAIGRDLLPRHAGEISKVRVPCRHLPQRITQIKPLGVAAAVVEPNRAFVPVMEGVVRDADERGEPRPISDEKQGLAGLARNAETVPVRTLEINTLAGFETFKNP